MAFCIAQKDSTFNDCIRFEKILNDSVVKKFLYSREHFVGFRNNSCYFNKCKFIKIDSEVYKIIDSVEGNTFDYDPVDIFIPGEWSNTIVLEWLPMEQAAVFDVKWKDGKPIVTLIRIDRMD